MEAMTADPRENGGERPCASGQVQFHHPRTSRQERAPRAECPWRPNRESRREPARIAAIRFQLTPLRISGTSQSVTPGFCKSIIESPQPPSPSQSAQRSLVSSSSPLPGHTPVGITDSQSAPSGTSNRVPSKATRSCKLPELGIPSKRVPHERKAPVGPFAEQDCLSFEGIPSAP